MIMHDVPSCAAGARRPGYAFFGEMRRHVRDLLCQVDGLAEGGDRGPRLAQPWSFPRDDAGKCGAPPVRKLEGPRSQRKRCGDMWKHRMNKVTKSIVCAARCR